MKPKVSYFVERGWPVRGVIHVGASDGEEVPGYKALGIDKIIAFEPLLPALKQFQKNYPGMLCLPYGLSNKKGVRTLYVTAGDGKGTSARKVIKDHPEVVEKWNHGQAEVVGKQRAVFMRFDFWASKTAIPMGEYNCLVLDAQGMSYEVLEGFGDYIKYLDYLVVELSETPVYKGEKSANEVIYWLNARGFEQLTPVQPHDDVLFRRVA